MVRLTIKIKRGNIEIVHCEGLFTHELNGIIHLSTRSNKVTLSGDITEFVKRHNGITVKKTEDRVEVYNDPFRTIPMFIRKTGNNELLLFSNVEDLYSETDFNNDIDEVGFWEILLFESGIYSRTLFKNIQQMVSASKIVIDKNNGYSIARYWDFNIRLNNSLNTIEKAADGLYERLREIFSSFNNEGKYLFGLSGGVDSRLTLGLLASIVSKENINLFTYGFNSSILEFSYARQIARVLGLNPPEFHKINIDSYRNAMFSLPRESGGHLGMQHSHTYDFLMNNKHYNNRTLICTYLTDALFGYAAKRNKTNESITDSHYYKILNATPFLKKEITEQIMNDVEVLLNGYNHESNFSSITEYNYVIERNAKFHTYLAHTLTRFIPCNLPYANYDLLSYMISIPLEIRYEKRLVSHLLSSHYFSRMAKFNIGYITSMFPQAQVYAGTKDYYSFRIINRMNAFLLLISGGYLRVWNKYLTEDLALNLHRVFKKDLRQAVSFFEKHGFLSYQGRQHYMKLPIRSGKELSQRYQLISLKSIFDFIPKYDL
jgi:uncharacterized protein